ncbi:MAG TPA: superinfection immunity protein [Rhizomicrobium sp.]|jgi:hypothetical protein
MLSFLLFLFVMYWLPTVIGMIRGLPSLLGLAALNFFLGWTVVGWVLALVWALAASPGPHVIVIDGATGRRI